MAENRDPEQKRGPGRPFEPGRSGNPGGRPKQVAKLLESFRKNVPAARRLAVQLMEDIEQDPRVRLEAAKLICSYGLGKPPSTEGVYEMAKRAAERLSEEELERLAREILARRHQSSTVTQ